ncbi:hypothetical protein Sjap_021595 [Stephania japonica]|uniref:Uncharacterized protein n=1 Tax=Stephania japonica TaxID=461633 RepID=A0AAP0EUG5_9MAGN
MGPSAPPATGADYAGASGGWPEGHRPLSGRRRGGRRVANHPFPPLSMVHMGWGKRSLLVGLPPPSTARMGLPCGAPPVGKCTLDRVETSKGKELMLGPSSTTRPGKEKIGDYL